MAEHIAAPVGDYVKAFTTQTAGAFATEEESVAEFDRLVEQSGAFTVYREVWGRYVNGRPNVVDQRPRVDRILVPTGAVIAAGWKHGPLAVECKASGVKLGKVVAQSLDYANAVFEIKPGFHIWCEWLFVWPLECPKGDLESVMAQFRIGWAKPGAGRWLLKFGTGACNAITIDQDGKITATELKMGTKRGNRG